MFKGQMNETYELYHSELCGFCHRVRRYMAQAGWELPDGEGAAPAPFDGSWTDACLRVAIQIAAALEHSHAAGVLHRDLKPSNVMLEPTGRAVLIDFGLTATRADGPSRVTATGAPVGTLLYMSPEQVGAKHESGTDVDERTDVYGLGVTLYELLALQPPFASAPSLDVQRAIVDGASDMSEDPRASSMDTGRSLCRSSPDHNGAFWDCGVRQAFGVRRRAIACGHAARRERRFATSSS